MIKVLFLRRCVSWSAAMSSACLGDYASADAFAPP